MTGHLGLVGRGVVQTLESADQQWVGLDIVEGDDVLNADLVMKRVLGCDAIVHLAAVEESDDPPVVPMDVTTASSERVTQVNVVGTRHVLAAAKQHRVRVVVFMSSVDVLGCFMGQGQPDYLPIDDDHPTYPRGSYAMSKLTSEDLCEDFTRDTGIPTVCLRPPGVFDENTYTFIKGKRVAEPEFEWTPFWEYGAFIDVNDLAGAVLCGLSGGITGHHRLLVCASDVSSSSNDSLALARRLMPDVPIRHAERFESDPYASLVDSSRARRVLGWRSEYCWRPDQVVR